MGCEQVRNDGDYSCRAELFQTLARTDADQRDHEQSGMQEALDCLRGLLNQ